jgi:pimeloyl-ACP methyl ester carboxylesterase
VIEALEDGKPDAPAVLLIQNAAVPITLWDPVIPQLAGGCRVIRADLLAAGRAVPAAGYGVPAQARRAGAVLDRLGVNRVLAIGHSSGGNVATALAEQRPGRVSALALINTGPSPDAKFPEPPAARLLNVPLAGRLLWQRKTEATIRKAARTGFAPTAGIPDALIAHVQAMTYRSFTATTRGYRDYISERSIPSRLAALGLPVLVIFGAADQRWRSTSVAGYRAVPGARVELLPGVGHTPIVDDPQTTGKLLLDFAAATHSRLGPGQCP